MKLNDCVWIGRAVSSRSWEYLAESLSVVSAGAVNEERMEEHSVSFLHLQINHWPFRVIILHPVVHLVCTILFIEYVISNAVQGCKGEYNDLSSIYFTSHSG